MYAYIHPECGKPAFLLVQRPKPGSPAASSNARHLDWTSIVYASSPMCGSCGQPVSMPLMTKNIWHENERHLVSRNKREGWYRGYRTSNVRHYNGTYVLFLPGPIKHVRTTDNVRRLWKPVFVNLHYELVI